MNTARKYRRTFAASVIAAAALTAGCSALPNPVSQVQLHPAGNPGAWLRDEFADGTREIEYEGVLCAISGDTYVVATPDDSASVGAQTSVVATSLSTGNEVWRDPGATCTFGSASADDKLAIFESNLTTDEPLDTNRGVLSIVEIATGDVLNEVATKGIAAPDAAITMRVLTVGDTNVISLPPLFMGVEGDDIVWSTPIAATDLFVGPDSTLLAATLPPASSAIIVDAKTGKIVVDENRAGRFTPTTDGFAFAESSWVGDPTHQLLSPDGSWGKPQPRANDWVVRPSLSDGVTYSFPDMSNTLIPYLVDASGRAAVFVDSDGVAQTPQGKLTLPRDFTVDDVRRASADGTILYVQNGVGQAALTTTDGEELTYWEWTADRNVIIGGCIVMADRKGGVIVVPAAAG